ncbi:MAG TPA: 1-acyl-sn-glycerol-3-phosphate acyltransferase [Candidatus Limnocylindrales bacterium]|jgi:1-acyl-sn-glycerol-3-phosphate acyltransferase
MFIALADLVSRKGIRAGRTLGPFVERQAIEVQAPTRSLRRYRAVHAILGGVARLYSSVRVEGVERFPSGPYVLCFTHQSWADPFYVFAAAPRCPRMYFFGPEQEEMRRGARNRLMRWGGAVVPYKPGNRGLVAATARVQVLLNAGSVLALAGEGRIHVGEGVVLPLRQGPAYLSLRAGVPLVPVAINGTGWLGFRRVVRVRIGVPIFATRGSSARPTADDVSRLTARAQAALEALVSDFADQPRPGRLERWLTELFNDWPEGVRPVVSTTPDTAPGSLPRAES